MFYKSIISNVYYYDFEGGLGGLVVSALDLQAEGLGFESWWGKKKFRQHTQLILDVLCVEYKVHSVVLGASVHA